MLSNGARSKATSLLESSSVRARIRKVLLQTSCTPFLKFPGNLFLSTSCRAGGKCNYYYFIFFERSCEKYARTQSFLQRKMGGVASRRAKTHQTSNSGVMQPPCSMNTPLHSPFDPILYHRGFSIGTKPPNYREVWSKKTHKQ